MVLFIAILYTIAVFHQLTNILENLYFLSNFFIELFSLFFRFVSMLSNSVAPASPASLITKRTCNKYTYINIQIYKYIVRNN